MTSTDSLAARIARRRLVIPFERDPSTSGVLVGYWSPRKRYSRNPPAIVRGGTLYCVRNGKPFGVRLPVIPCADPDELDPARLLDRVLADAGEGMPVVPSPGIGALHGMDPFADLAWGNEFSFGPWNPILIESEERRQVSPSTFEAAVGQAALLVGAIVSAARESFAARLDDAAADTMAFMRARLPYFTWGAYRALERDADGGARAFAVEHPLVAGRSLASGAVVRAADAGDFASALRRSLRDSLLGPWPRKGLAAYPSLSRLADGSRREDAVDRALSMAVHLDRNHVPRDPETFRAYVDACAWVEAADVRCDPVDERFLLREFKGNWSRGLAACTAAASVQGKAMAVHEAKDAMGEVNYRFGQDFLDPALRVHAGSPARSPSLGSATGSLDFATVCTRMVFKGMAAPDRIRHGVRYLAAKPTIAGIGRDPAKSWISGNLLVGEMPWLGLDEAIEIKPLFLGSIRSAHEWSSGRKPSEKRFLHYVYLPASTQGGEIVSICLRRGPHGPSAHRRIERYNPDRIRAALGSVLAAHYGHPSPTGLGDAMLARHGVLEAFAASGEAVLRPLEDRLKALQAAWGPALPRRFRRPEAKALAAQLAGEYETLLSELHRT